MSRTPRTLLGAARASLVLVGALVACVVGGSLPGTILPAARAATPPKLPVRAAILYAPATGQVLYADNADAELPIASATKLMTALITLERARLGSVLTEPNYYPAPADSQIGLVPGERMSVHDLLLALLLPSADDAAEDLAWGVGKGSVARFIAMMNARARQLGLAHTHFTTPIGLDTPGNYSSASDLARLAAYDLSHSRFFARAVALPQAVLHSGSHPRLIINRNDLVGRIPGIDGVKTGHTSQAGYLLVGAGVRQGLRLISVVLGTDSLAARDSATLALLGYGWSSFHVTTVLRRDAVVGRPTVRDQPDRHPAIITARGLAQVVLNGERLTVRLSIPNEIAGPLPRHAVLGTATVLSGHHVVARIPLELAQAVPAVSSLTLAARFITRPSTLVGLLLLLVVLGAVIGRRRLTYRHREEVERA